MFECDGCGMRYQALVAADRKRLPIDWKAFMGGGYEWHSCGKQPCNRTAKRKAKENE